MTMQARMTANDQRLYNPSRDVAHNFQQVMEMVAGRLEDYSWTELSEVLKREQTTMDDLGEACGAYCDYLATSAKMPHWSMYDSLEHCGFFKTKPAAQVAVLAMTHALETLQKRLRESISKPGAAGVCIVD